MNCNQRDIAEDSMLAIDPAELRRIIDCYEREGKDDNALNWLRSSLAVACRRAADTHDILERQAEGLRWQPG